MKKDIKPPSKPALAVLLLFASMSAFAADTPATLDKALKEASEYFESNLTANNTIAVVNITGGNEKLSSYMIDELNNQLLKSKKFKIIDRQNLELIKAEQDYQLSGDVSDDSAVSIGHELGAQTIITGSIAEIGKIFHINLRAIGVETAQIEGIFSLDVKRDKKIESLIAEKAAQKTDIFSGLRTLGLSFGARAGVGLHNYKLSDSLNGELVKPLHTTFDAAVFTSVPVLKYLILGKYSVLSFQTELDFSNDKIEYSNISGEGDYESSLESFSFALPLLVKLSIDLTDKIVLSPLAGAYFTFPIGDAKYQSNKTDNVWCACGINCSGVFKRQCFTLVEKG
jgi:TolB-like protein